MMQDENDNGGKLTELKLVELRRDRVLRASELQARADQNPWSKYRFQYLATSAGVEVAFLSFDLLPGKDYLVLYELFVVAASRGLGIGSALLVHAEDIARERGLRSLLVRPGQLVSEISKDQLNAWYSRRGFAPWPEDPEVLAKGL